MKYGHRFLVVCLTHLALVLSQPSQLFLPVLSIKQPLPTFSPASQVLPVSKRLPEQSIEDITDALIFTTPISTFIDHRSNNDPPTLDWTSDGCSHAPDKPLPFDFGPMCIRHDFGYRNTKKQERFTAEMKDRLDYMFLDDMMEYCEGMGLVRMLACNTVAETYYLAVRAWGEKVV